jgi:hypothetical protein
MTLFAPSCSSTEGEPDPTVKRTPDVPDDRSLCFALKLYRQRHDLPRAGGDGSGTARARQASCRASRPASRRARLCRLRRERETQGPPWSKLAASRQSPVRASLGWHQLTRKQVDMPRTLALLYTGCHCTMPNRTGQEANKKPAPGGFFGRLWTTLALVPRGGIEPPRCFHRRILSPLRLPIPPSRLVARCCASRKSAAIIADSPGSEQADGSNIPPPPSLDRLHQPAGACSRSTISTSICPAN